MQGSSWQQRVYAVLGAGVGLYLLVTGMSPLSPRKSTPACTCKVAMTSEEAQNLIKSDFEYVAHSDMDKAKILRKRKMLSDCGCML